jgi:1,4-dihydroxy-2-naphthoate polyprenyltransferase
MRRHHGRAPVNVWVEAARPRTLPAAVVPVAVGTAAAHAVGRARVVGHRAARAVVALALQVAVNYANDLFDGVAGIDTEERVGPRRVVAAGLVSPGAMKRALVVALGVAGVAGSRSRCSSTPWLLLVGVAAIARDARLLGWRRPYASRALGEVSVFVFFGVVATVGSAFVQTGTLDLLAVAVSLPVGLLAVGLLMINNVRDVETDAATGKRTLAVRLGARTYGHAFGWLLLATFAHAGCRAARGLALAAADALRVPAGLGRREALARGGADRGPAARGAGVRRRARGDRAAAARVRALLTLGLVLA